ncbi:MAG: hypothetical protein JWR19_1744 [Pedosphaera sp.]|nr:hypothetical protein [Pedosphaera sp.]
MIVLAVSRIPGLLPWNFSMVYALVFCAGVYFPKALAWWLPLATLLVTDLLLNWHFHAPLLGPEMLGNYLSYAALILLGRQFTRKSPFLALLGGGILGAVLFYFISNTISWLFNPFHNPEYTKTLAGWLIAMTNGTAGWPQTWEFFRNTLMSGGLFTGLFVGAMKLVEALEPAEAEEPAEEPTEDQPEEVKAH